MGKTFRAAEIHLRVSGLLRARLEDEAAAHGRSLSNLIRQILIDHAEQRFAGEQKAA